MIEEDKHIPWDKITNQIRSNQKDIQPDLLNWINESIENQAFFDDRTFSRLYFNLLQEFYVAKGFFIKSLKLKEVNENWDDEKKKKIQNFRMFKMHQSQ